MRVRQNVVQIINAHAEHNYLHFLYFCYSLIYYYIANKLIHNDNVHVSHK